MPIQSEVSPHAARMQAQLDKLFGITHDLAWGRTASGVHRAVQGAALPDDVEPFPSLRSAYQIYTGDMNFQDVGGICRALQNFNTPTFGPALANTLNKLLILPDYRTDYRWRDIVTSITSARDFRPQTRVRVDYVSDIPDVSEDEPITEIPVSGAESVSYTINSKEALMTVTRRAIVNDDVDAIKRTVEQIRRAAWRTLAKRVWNKVINNDVYGVDGLAMFHANHGNLGADALSTVSLSAARKAIFEQTEPGGSEKLGLSGPFLLVLPIDLEDTAWPINNLQLVPGTLTFAGNPWYHRFGRDSERIFTNPLLTDTNDWYLFDISGNAGIIEVGCLNGEENPVIVLDDLPLDSPMLYQDRAIFKVRHEYEASISDFRGAYKAVVV